MIVIQTIFFHVFQLPRQASTVYFRKPTVKQNTVKTNYLMWIQKECQTVNTVVLLNKTYYFDKWRVISQLPG